MLLIALAYAGGVLTIVSPCILPVLPFVFAQADRPFVRAGLPTLIGMAATFAVVASLAAVGGSWAVHANQWGRWIALALVALFGLALLAPSIAERASRPLVALGGRLSDRAGQGGGIGSSLLLGVATGLLWAPCAGPVLGLILTGAALNGASAETASLLLAYAAGAATSLGLAILIGGKVFAAMKRSLGAGEWIRRGLGAAVLAGVAAIALGLDTGLLARLSLASTAPLEQALVDRVRPKPEEPSVVMAPGEGGAMMMQAGGQNAGPAMMAMRPKGAPGKADALPDEGAAPSIAGAVEWLNSKPLTDAELRGKVVLVDFWTYSCINCLRALPYVRAWAEKYRDSGLVVIGVHAPEFAFEKDLGNVKRAVSELKIDYPVAVDNDYAIWRAFKNQYWPAHYFIDANGRIRHHHFGEGAYDVSEKVIRQLLAEAGQKTLPGGGVNVTAGGAQAAADMDDVKSPETYVGYDRAENFISPGGAVQNAAHTYEAGPAPRLNEWSLSGDWTVEAENAALNSAGGKIRFRFHARDLHLVLGPGDGGAPARFRVTIDGAAPKDSHGVDVDENGEGLVTEHRLYQLVRQSGPVGDHMFEIEFLDPGPRAFAFTFG